VRREADVSKFSEIPYVIGLACSSLVTAYALLTPGRTLPMITNAFGAACYSFYCTIFIIHTNNPRDFVRVRRRVVGTLFGITSVILFGVFFAASVFPSLPIWLSNVTASPATDFVGVASSFLTAANYASPLSVMGEVIATRSVDFMPLPMTLATLCAATAWSAFSFYIGDAFIGVPNYMGVCLGLAQVALYRRYRPGSKWAKEPMVVPLRVLITVPSLDGISTDYARRHSEADLFLAKKKFQNYGAGAPVLKASWSQGEVEKSSTNGKNETRISFNFDASASLRGSPWNETRVT